MILKQLGGEWPIAMAVEVGLSAIDERVGLVWRKERRHELHHPEIGVHGLKRKAVGVAPAAKEEAAGGDRVAHWRASQIQKGKSRSFDFVRRGGLRSG